jgi:hypothetical protein
MAVNRILQLKRNGAVYASRQAAIDNIGQFASDLKNGEVIIASYTDENAENQKADMLIVKALDKVFHIDTQEILDKLGTRYNEVLSFGDGKLSGATTYKNAITTLENIIDENEEAIEELIESLSATSVANDNKVVSDVTQTNGKITATAKNITEVKLDGYEIATVVSEVADTDTLGQALGKLQKSIDEIGTGTGAKLDELSGKVETLSAKTITSVEDTSTIDFTEDNNASDGTKKIKADVKISEVSGNIITTKTDGIFTQVDYNPTTNSLIINGTEKQLNAGSVIDSMEYSAATESLVITYHDTTGGTHTVVAPLGDLITEYDFDDDEKTSESNYNVKFNVTRNVSGATTVEADVEIFDCGTY